MQTKFLFMLICRFFSSSIHSFNSSRELWEKEFEKIECENSIFFLQNCSLSLTLWFNFDDILWWWCSSLYKRNNTTTASTFRTIYNDGLLFYTFNFDFVYICIISTHTHTLKHNQKGSKKEVSFLFRNHNNFTESTLIISIFFIGNHSLLTMLFANIISIIITTISTEYVCRSRILIWFQSLFCCCCQSIFYCKCIWFVAMVPVIV